MGVHGSEFDSVVFRFAVLLALEHVANRATVFRPQDSAIDLSPFRFKQIRGRDYTTCGLTLAGNPVCWGGDVLRLSGSFENGRGPVEIEGGPFLDIAVTNSAICALDFDNQLHCFGRNYNSMIPDQDENARSTEPRLVGVDLKFENIEASKKFMCGTTVEQDVYCWGKIAGEATPVTKLRFPD